LKTDPAIGGIFFLYCLIFFDWKIDRQISEKKPSIFVIMKSNNLLPNEKIRLVDFGTGAYNEMIDLRYEILRKPLNLTFTEEQLAAEKNFYHLGYYLDDVLVGCLMLTPEENGKIKMKQVAVAANTQRIGIGAKLVNAAEAFAKEKGFQIMYCHARDLAVPFYEKLGYNKIGEMFIQVTIPHYYMEKEL